MTIALYGIPNCERVVAVGAKKMAGFCGLLLGLLLVAFPAVARHESVYPACSVPAHWVADGAVLLEHQMFHLVTLARDGSVRWNGRPTSDRRLQAHLHMLGAGTFRKANQVGLSVAEGASCSRVVAVRGLMEKALDCHIGMCRNGSLRQPPPPPSAHNGSIGMERRRVE